MFGKTNGLFPMITSKLFCGGGGPFKMLLKGISWPTPPPTGGKRLFGFVPFSIKSSNFGNVGGGPKLFISIPPPPGLILLLLLFLLKF